MGLRKGFHRFRLIGSIRNGETPEETGDSIYLNEASIEGLEGIKNKPGAVVAYELTTFAGKKHLVSGNDGGDFLFPKE